MFGFMMLFYFYVGQHWLEIEKFLSNVIKVKSQKTAKHKNWAHLFALKRGERRCYRSYFMLRGKPFDLCYAK
jgi:hypothetical protein